MPRQIRHPLIRCRADEYGADWHTMPDGTEVLAYSPEAAREAWKDEKSAREADRRQQAEQPELL